MLCRQHEISVLVGSEILITATALSPCPQSGPKELPKNPIWTVWKVEYLPTTSEYLENMFKPYCILLEKNSYGKHRHTSHILVLIKKYLVGLAALAGIIIWHD